MPLAKLVTGLGRPDPTPRTVYVTVHDPDDPLAAIPPTGPAGHPDISVLVTRAVAGTARRIRRGGSALAARLRRSRHRPARSC